MEIERKFLIDGFPNLKCLRTVDIYQGYVSITPEVRVRSYKYDEHIDYKLTIKGDGDLSREEVETYIDENTFLGIVNIIGKPLIYKRYKKYELPNGLILECSNVDVGSDCGFMYAEIEFESENHASKFKPLKCLGKEVTYDSAYKMKNYWKQTRG